MVLPRTFPITCTVKLFLEGKSLSKSHVLSLKLKKNTHLILLHDT